jgi:antitoxin (DNA-binding transcriptional repressor) of toxin-antitoxin stability system
MKASIVDLRYKMKDVLKALDRNEQVTILYHGKVKGVIIPTPKQREKRVEEHPFFGMLRHKKKPVLEELKDLRRPRYSDI